MSLTLLCGGDVSFSAHRGEIRHLVERQTESLASSMRAKLIRRVFHQPPPDTTCARPVERILLEDYGGSWQHSPASVYPMPQNPFEHLARRFHAADVAYANLETPLVANGRHIGSFCSDPMYASVMKDNGVDVVSIANNHIFDAGERGLSETMRVLEENGIDYVGGGMTIAEARRGRIVEVGGVSIGFLAYTALCNSLFMSLATRQQPGILPLFEPIVLDDIRAMRKRCDFLVVAPHFDLENTNAIAPYSIAVAHRMVDSGADLVLGSHGHVPKPIEVYKRRLIIYCLGNLVFPFSCANWGYSLLAEVTISVQGQIQKAKFHAVNGVGPHCGHPLAAEDQEGDALLTMVKSQSERRFRTRSALQSHCIEIGDFQ